MPTSIRNAKETDIPRMVELGMKSLKDGPYAGLIKENPEKAAETALRIIRESGGKVLLYENENGKIVGLFAFVIYPQIFTGERTANELMWYVEPEEREGGAGTKLLWAAERLAKDMGARYMAVTSPTAQVSQLYQRFGYKQIEIAYLRPLCHS